MPTNGQRLMQPYNMNISLVTYFGKTKEGGLKEVPTYISKEEWEGKYHLLEKEGKVGKSAIKTLREVGVEGDIYLLFYNCTELFLVEDFKAKDFKFELDRKELETKHNKGITWGEEKII